MHMYMCVYIHISIYTHIYTSPPGSFKSALWKILKNAKTRRGVYMYIYTYS